MAKYRYHQKRSFLQNISPTHCTILFFAGLLFLFFILVASISEDTIDRQEEALTNALHRNIVSCYCVEGTYPPSLDYILEHYGLTYDSDSFFVDYKPIGANIYPDVTIIRKE